MLWIFVRHLTHNQLIIRLLFSHLNPHPLTHRSRDHSIRMYCLLEYSENSYNVVSDNTIYGLYRKYITFEADIGHPIPRQRGNDYFAENDLCKRLDNMWIKAYLPSSLWMCSVISFDKTGIFYKTRWISDNPLTQIASTTAVHFLVILINNPLRAIFYKKNKDVSIIYTLTWHS